MDVFVERMSDPPPGGRAVEIVERKGIGHPDTICDALAETVSGALCRYYMERFGRVLHHNVDKALLCGGASTPRFGGGEVVEPIEIILGGRSAIHHDGEPIEVVLNAADDPGRERFYLTVTGTSAESGDDGEVGRGNRTNGLITPGRPMTIEAAAGKNPVSHVGKLYNIVAAQLARDLVAVVPGVSAADCVLVSRIGAPVDEPQIVQLRLWTSDHRLPAEPLAGASDIVRENLRRTPALSEQLAAGGVDVY